MTNFNKKIINSRAYSLINKYIKEPYKLNKQGCKIVINANRNLQSHYFEHLIFPVSNFWKGYFRKKLKILKPTGNNYFLDVCCGTGSLCLNVMSDLKFKKCMAIDNSDYAINMLKRRKKNKNIVAKKIEINSTKIKPNTFDAVYGNSFLHHLPDNITFLKSVKKILKPGGVMIFTGEPSISAEILETMITQNILKIFHFFKIKKKINHNPHYFLTDIWLYDHKIIKQILLDIGFKDVKIKSFSFLSAIFNSTSSIFFKLLTGKSFQPDWYWWLIEKIDEIFFFLPTNFRSHFIIAARKI
jgi:ubiquinone/menaquinone biosynthesis C-methylase UbiE